VQGRQSLHAVWPKGMQLLVRHPPRLSVSDVMQDNRRSALPYQTEFDAMTASAL
jgi:hypothetical protein